MADRSKILVQCVLSVTAVMNLCGCRATLPQKVSLQPKDPQFLKSYFTQITKYDGIDEHEALLLAQSQLKFEGTANAYYIDHPEIISYDEEHWLVEFPPLSKTFAESRRSTSVIFIIDKVSGSVRHFKQ